MQHSKKTTIIVMMMMMMMMMMIMMEMEMAKNNLLNELRVGNVFFEMSALESSQLRLPLRESVFVK